MHDNYRSKSPLGEKFSESSKNSTSGSALVAEVSDWIFPLNFTLEDG